jgi:hypothetical protein
MTMRSPVSPQSHRDNLDVVPAPPDGRLGAAQPGGVLHAVDDTGSMPAGVDGVDGVDHHTAGESVSIDERDLFHLRRRLETLPVIEQSKGILMRHYGIDADAAFDLLRRWACDNNRKLRDISQEVVAAATAANEPQPSLKRFLHELQSGAEHRAE